MNIQTGVQLSTQFVSFALFTETVIFLTFYLACLRLNNNDVIYNILLLRRS